MKIYFRNKSARLKLSSFYATCNRCPFNVSVRYCSFGRATIVNCAGKGWWVAGESLDIFKV